MKKRFENGLKVESRIEKKCSVMAKRENLTAYSFLMPSLIVFVALVLFPIVFSFFLSFTEWNFLSGLKGIKIVGLNNFKTLFSDAKFMQAVKNTFIYTITTVPTSILLALALAYVVNEKAYGKKLLRSCFFIPYISSAVALATVFKILFREDGPVNMFAQMALHTDGPIKWFVSPALNKIPIIIFMIWTAIGYELVVYMAALQGISPSLYESAKIDGAGSLKCFLKITFPLISPTTFYLVIVRMIAAFKVFSAIDIMTLGLPARENTSIVVKVYEEAFRNYRFGLASAQAWVLVAIILVVTLINFRVQKKWVHY